MMAYCISPFNKNSDLTENQRILKVNEFYNLKLQLQQYADSWSVKIVWSCLRYHSSSSTTVGMH